jgi:hypothetical protein
VSASRALCCAVLCCAVLCCAVLCCAVLCCAVLVWRATCCPHLPLLCVSQCTGQNGTYIHAHVLYAGARPRTSSHSHTGEATGNRGDDQQNVTPRQLQQRGRAGTTLISPSPRTPSRRSVPKFWPGWKSPCLQRHSNHSTVIAAVVMNSGIVPSRPPRPLPRPQHPREAYLTW